ncbi:MAG: hypothetical protein ISS45_08095 [Candidatus Omnitrophica bacterium]|nr:hypothetical protein [Candidatus Omnitrophota bacterium]
MPEQLPNYPRRLRIDREVNDKYFEPIINEKSSPFYKKGKTGVYIISAALGYKDKVKKKTQKGIDICNINELDQKVLWLLLSIAISEKKNTGILLDGLNTMRIAEEYANGGAKILFDKIFSKKFDFSMDNEIIKILDKEFGKTKAK